MITLVIGGSDCGKSELAESIASESGLRNRYYIATMKVVDEESRARRERHRAKREGKGFVTLEIPVLIGSAPDLMAGPRESAVLLECVANLVGNIMHESEWEGRLKAADSETGDAFVRSVISIIRDLADQVGHLIVVSATYPRENTDDEETAVYKDVLDAVNARLRRISDKVCEL